MAKSKTPGWLVPAIFVTGVIAFWGKVSSASQPKKTVSNVQTATVGNRVYSVNRLGQGTYLVSLVSTNGVFESTPVTFTFNQTQSLGDFGPSEKVAQLKADLNAMNVNFNS